MKKVFLLGLLSGLVMLVVGMLLNYGLNWLFPSLIAEYENGFFRAWTDPLMSLYFLHTFVIGIGMAWVWNRTKSLFKTGKGCKKALLFTLAVFLLTILPGMLITYASFQVSLLMVLSWTIGSLIYTFFGVRVITALNK